jgi:hypothetical protein
MAVKHRLVTQQNQIVLSTIPFCVVYWLVAARVIPLTYWLMAAIFLGDAINTFFFTFSNLRFSARRGKETSSDDNPRPVSVLAGSQVKLNNTAMSALRSTTAKDSSIAENQDY